MSHLKRFIVIWKTILGNLLFYVCKLRDYHNFCETNLEFPLQQQEGIKKVREKISLRSDSNHRGIPG